MSSTLTGSWPFLGKKSSDTNKADIEVKIMNIDEVCPGELQPRDHFNDESLQELSRSIKTQGVLQPIILNLSNGKYSIIAGERRWRASKLAGLSTIPAIIKEYNDKAVFEAALIENIQREDLTAIAEAKGYKKLINDFSYTQEQISACTGKSRSHIANLTRLLTLPENVQEMIATKKLTLGHARCLVGLENSEEIAQEILDKKLNVRASEELIKNLTDTNQPEIHRPILHKPKKPTNSRSNDAKKLEEILSKILDAKITLDAKSKNGKIVIEYTNMDHLDNIISRLSKI